MKVLKEETEKARDINKLIGEEDLEDIKSNKYLKGFC